MQKVINIKPENDNDDNGEVTLMKVIKNFKETCYICGNKGYEKQSFSQKVENTKKARPSSQVTAIPAVRRGIMMLIVVTQRKMKG